MTDNEYIESIRNFILSNKKPSYQTTNHKEVHIRCPYCGDSKSNPSAAHLYIEMKPPFRFHCFKCETSGVLSISSFKDFGLYSNDLSLNLINANKQIKKGNQQTKLVKNPTLKNSVVSSITTTNNINYFNNRFNTNFDGNYISNKFKIILDPINFFQENNMVVQNLYDFSNSIGFISSDNSHLIFRDTSGKQKTRYFNLSLYPDSDFSLSSKMYNISSKIDVMQEKIKLVITEGIFDIIGVYNAFYSNKNEENVIFAAACGKAYNAVILNYIKKGFLNLDIEIYSDADVDLNFFKYLKNSSPYLNNRTNITVYYNNLYDPMTKSRKDFGIPKEEIQLKKFII